MADTGGMRGSGPIPAQFGHRVVRMQAFLMLDVELIGGYAGVGVERATVLVGPPLILTSAVLACGLAMTVFSSLPSLRLFGWLSAFAMIAALVADLFILRPVAMTLSKLMRRAGGRHLSGPRHKRVPKG